jgi:hypothetical protein
MGQYANNIKKNVLVDGTYLFSRSLDPVNIGRWFSLPPTYASLACTSALHANNNRYIKMMRKKEKGKEKKKSVKLTLMAHRKKK